MRAFGWPSKAMPAPRTSCLHLAYCWSSRLCSTASPCGVMAALANKEGRHSVSSLIGCHALVFTGEFDSRGIESSVQRSHQAGFDLIEFPLMEPATFDSATARRVVDGEGLHATASLGLPLDADISSDDPSIVRAGRQLLDIALDKTAEMGGLHLCGVLYGSCGSTWRPHRPAVERTVSQLSNGLRIERHPWECRCRWKSSTAMKAT